METDEKNYNMNEILFNFINKQNEYMDISKQRYIQNTNYHLIDVDLINVINKRICLEENTQNEFFYL